MNHYGQIIKGSSFSVEGDMGLREPSEVSQTIELGSSGFQSPSQAPSCWNWWFSLEQSGGPKVGPWAMDLEEGPHAPLASPVWMFE